MRPDFCLTPFWEGSIIPDPSKSGKGIVSMEAVIMYGERHIRVEQVEVPKQRGLVLNSWVAGLCLRHTLVCSPAVFRSHRLGHEFSGDVVEVGQGIGDLRQGDQFCVDKPDGPFGACTREESPHCLLCMLQL